jgi:hypothetical protein
MKTNLTNEVIKITAIGLLETFPKFVQYRSSSKPIFRPADLTEVLSGVPPTVQANCCFEFGGGRLSTLEFYLWDYYFVLFLQNFILLL